MEEGKTRTTIAMKKLRPDTAATDFLFTAARLAEVIHENNLNANFRSSP